ncbi:M24 family metallopeptidase [soil metagenome]
MNKDELIDVGGDGRTCYPVSRLELERRWALLRECLARHQLDAIVLQGANGVSGGGYFRWATGQASGNYNPRTVVFAASGDMSLIDQGPFGMAVDLDPNAGPMPGISHRIGVPSYPSVHYTNRYDAELVVRELRRRGLGRIGVAGITAMPFAFYSYLQSTYGADLVDVTDELDVLKAPKSEEEKRLIRASAAMQDRIVAKVAEHIRPGMRDFEVMAYAQYLGQLEGSELGMFFGSSAPPGQPAVLRPRSQQGRKLHDGDMFTLLVENSGPGGQFTHLARPIVLGKAPQELKDAWAAALEAQTVTLDMLAPGADCAEIFAKYNEHMLSRGLAIESRLHCHGQGYDLVERPLIRHDETMHLSADMNIAAHPALVMERLFVTVCENYLINADGSLECVHKSPKNIIELC